MSEFRIFKGTLMPHAGIRELPAPPPWRSLSTRFAATRGATFQLTDEMITTVNAALHLRRPILITGNPGTGKSSLIHAVARELALGEPFVWPVTSRSTVRDALYRYDALGRLQDQQLRLDRAAPGTSAEDLDIGDYVRLGPLGSALAPSEHPRALLIDEIDKSDLDLANDLLNVLDEGDFEIPELARVKLRREVRVRLHRSDEFATLLDGHLKCTQFPFTVLTSNREREFPPAFLRRCLRLSMPDPDAEQLARIVSAHLGQPAADPLVKDLIERFAQRETGTLATDQLLNAVFLVTGMKPLSEQEREQLIEIVYREIAPAAESGSEPT